MQLVFFSNWTGDGMDPEDALEVMSPQDYGATHACGYTPEWGCEPSSVMSSDDDIGVTCLHLKQKYEQDSVLAVSDDGEDDDATMLVGTVESQLEALKLAQSLTVPVTVTEDKKAYLIFKKAADGLREWMNKAAFKQDDTKKVRVTFY